MFQIIALEHCPFSEKAVKTFENLAKQNTNIKLQTIWVNSVTKNKYKTSEHNTFPQIYYHVQSSNGLNTIFIGGNDNIDDLVQITRTLRDNYGPQIIVPLLQLMNAI
jgi:glutaredoxin-related protein